MDIRKRYTLTAGGIIILLVSLVAAARFFSGTYAFAGYDNLKVKGPKDAPIHIVVYSDFQCPACFHAIAPTEDLKNQFPGLIQVEYRHYPLEHAHRWALLAATFAECAAEQGKFWEFHEKLFSRQSIWSKSEDAVPFFAEYSQETGLDRAKLGLCLEDPKTLEKIRKEHAVGVKQKVQSTPTILINEHLLVGAPQLKAQAAQIITEELKKLKKG